MFNRVHTASSRLGQPRLRSETQRGLVQAPRCSCGWAIGVGPGGTLGAERSPSERCITPTPQHPGPPHGLTSGPHRGGGTPTDGREERVTPFIRDGVRQSRRRSGQPVQRGGPAGLLPSTGLRGRALTLRIWRDRRPGGGTEGADHGEARDAGAWETRLRDHASRTAAPRLPGESASSGESRPFKARAWVGTSKKRVSLKLNFTWLL